MEEDTQYAFGSCVCMVSQGKWYGCRYCFLESPLPLSGCLNSLHIVPHEIQVHERKMKREEGAMVFKLKLKIANAKLEMKVSDNYVTASPFSYSNFTVFFFAINFCLKNLNFCSEDISKDSFTKTDFRARILHLPLCLWCYCITTPTKTTLHSTKYYHTCDVM